MKILILILSFTYTYGQSDSVTQWETVRVLVGAEDTTWIMGLIHMTSDSVGIQYRSNCAVIQRREIWYKRD